MTDYDGFSISLEVHVRPCREDDLPTLEWFGMFSEHRELIRAQYERSVSGEALFLAADIHGVASGQAWVDFEDDPEGSKAVVWAVRVFPSLQNTGIGSRLVRTCERLSAERGSRFVELSVERNNPGAGRLYDRLGYERREEVDVEYAGGVHGRGNAGNVAGRLLYRKILAPRSVRDGR